MLPALENVWSWKALLRLVAKSGKQGALCMFDTTGTALQEKRETWGRGRNCRMFFLSTYNKSLLYWNGLNIVKIKLKKNRENRWRLKVRKAASLFWVYFLSLASAYERRKCASENRWKLGCFPRGHFFRWLARLLTFAVDRLRKKWGCLLSIKSCTRLTFKK